MKCSDMQSLMLRKLDDELSESENGMLYAHLARCASCAREFGLLTVPRRIARTLSPPETSSYFYQKLKIGIENESRNAAILQLSFGLARRIIPSMAAIALVLLSVFTYLEWNNPQDDLHAAYEKMFAGADLPLHLVVTEQRNITDERILNVIAAREIWQDTNLETK